MFDPADGGVERALLAAEAVVSFGEAVDGDTGVLEPGVPQRRGRLAGDQGAVRGQDGSEPAIRRVGDEFDQIVADEGFAAGEEDDGCAEVGELVEERLRLGRRELAGRGLGLGTGITVRTVEVTPTGRVPDDDRPLLFLLGDLWFLRVVGRVVAQSVALGVEIAEQFADRDHRLFTSEAPAVSL